MTETRARYLPALPSLAIEQPTAWLTLRTVRGFPVRFGVAEWCAALCEGMGDVTDGDLERLITLGALAAEERKARWAALPVVNEMTHGQIPERAH